MDNEGKYSDVGRIANALERIAENQSSETPAQIIASLHGFYANEVEAILDAMNNDFELRRALRNLVNRAKQAALQ